jgi:hypothetical protein
MQNGFNLRFSQRRKSGSIILAQAGPDQYAVVLRKFDPETGVELSPDQHLVQLSQLEQQRAQMVTQHETELAEMDAFIAALKATKKSLFDVLSAEGAQPAPPKDK